MSPTNPLPFNLTQELFELSAGADNKADRTRLRLLASAAELLNEMPFTQMRPADLAERAEVSRALIYHHFADLPDLVTHLMGAFHRRLLVDLLRLAPGRDHDDYASIVRYLAWTLAVFMNNRGIMQLLFVHADQVPGVGAIVEDILHASNKGLGASMKPPAGLTWGGDDQLVAGYIIGGGVSDLLRRMLIPGHDQLPAPKSVAELFGVVQVMAVVRHREVHARDPSTAELKAVAQGFDRSVFDGCDFEIRESSSTPSRPASMPRLRRMANKDAG